MHPTPLLANLDAADAQWERYGPAREGGPSIAVAGAFDAVELEYAAIRKTAAVLDQPARGTLEVTGADAAAFLNRMVTQELKNWPVMTTRRAFWLSRKGRIDADLRLLNLGDRILLDVDALVAPDAAKSLGAYIIADDVNLTDVTQRWHRLGLHGPGAAAVLATLTEPLTAPTTPANDALPAAPGSALVPVAELAPGQITRALCAGTEIIIDRADTAGEIGLELTIPAAAARAVFEHLLQAAHTPDIQQRHANPTSLHTRAALRPIGWHAYNIARIEAGTPLFLLDFGTSALPAESGVLADRVSFTKGCYLGQEIVARMHALGKPKQVVVALRIGERPTHAGGEHEPATVPEPHAAAALYIPGGTEPIGAISSATASPMLGGSTIALASVKTAQSAPGTTLELQLHPDAPRVQAIVQPKLAFWSRAGV